MRREGNDGWQAENFKFGVDQRRVKKASHRRYEGECSKGYRWKEVGGESKRQGARGELRRGKSQVAGGKWQQIRGKRSEVRGLGCKIRDKEAKEGKPSSNGEQRRAGR